MKVKTVINVLAIFIIVAFLINLRMDPQPNGVQSLEILIYFVGFFLALAMALDIRDLVRNHRSAKSLKTKLDAISKIIGDDESKLIATANLARKKIKAKRYLDQVNHLESLGVAVVKSARLMLVSLASLGKINPQSAISSIHTIKYLDLGESQVTIALLLENYLKASKEAPGFMSRIELELEMLRTQIQELANLGYKIDTVQEFADTELILDEAKSYLTADTYDPDTAMLIGIKASDYLCLVYERYATLEELRQSNKSYIVQLGVDLKEAKKQMLKIAPAKLAELEQYPESIWKDAKKRLVELQTNNWATFLGAQLREAIQLNSDKVLLPTPSAKKLEQIQKTLSSALGIIQKPAELIGGLKKSSRVDHSLS